MKISRVVPEHTVAVEVYAVEHHFGTGVIAVRDTKGQINLDLRTMIDKHGKLAVKEYFDALMKEAYNLKTLEKSITDERTEEEPNDPGEDTDTGGTEEILRS